MVLHNLYGILWRSRGRDGSQSSDEHQQPSSLRAYSTTIGSACIEMATTHRRYPATDPSTRHLAGWWDWCLSTGKPNSPSIEENMENLTWQSWYTRSLTGVGKVFYIQIFKDTQQGYPCWNGLIYNYNFGYWESKWYSCYPVGRTSNWTGNGNEGWSMWEMFGVNEKPCPSLVGTGAYFLKVIGTNGSPLVNISQVAPNLSSGFGVCWTSSSWSMIYTKRTADSDWRAKTPNL
jgi:hypothetical protein